MRIQQRAQAHAGRRGAAYVMALFLFMAMASLSFMFVTLTQASHKENGQALEQARTDYVAEAILNEAIAVLAHQGEDALGELVFPMEALGATVDLVFTPGSADPDLDDDLMRIVATATGDRQSSGIEVVVRLGPDEEERFPYGIFGRDRVSMNSNSTFDSFDSDLGAYVDQLTGKWKGKDYALLASSVGSNGPISLDSNSGIFGDAIPGPGESVTTAGNSKVFGATTPATELVTVPGVVLPTISGPGGDLTRDKGKKTLPSGDYQYKNFSIDSNATLVIQGPARFLVENYCASSNGTIIADTTNGPVEFYVTGDFEQSSNAEFYSTGAHPSDISIVVDGTGSDVVFESNTSLLGTLYAPERRIWLKSNVEMWGAVVGKEIHLDSNVGVHFDLALSRSGTAGDEGVDVDVLRWRRVTAQ